MYISICIFYLPLNKLKTWPPNKCNMEPNTIVRSNIRYYFADELRYASYV